jgi:hypothetical protein
MTFTLPTPRGRILLIFLSSFFAAAICYFALRNALAVHFRELDTREGYLRAVELEPSDARNWYLLGRSYLYDLEQPDPRRAIQALRKAVELDRNSSEALLDLANAYDGEGDPSQARQSYLSAQRVYPLSADVCWSYGNFLLRQGESDAAFAQLHRAVELEPRRASEAFALAIRVQPDAATYLDKIVPASAANYVSIVRALSDAGDLDTAQLVWTRLVALRQRVSLRDLVPYIDALKQKRGYLVAYPAWLQAVSIMQNPPPADPPGSLIWDGGFESGFAGGGFAWEFSTMTKNARLSFDRTERHSGSQSVRIMFNGRENLNFEDSCQPFLPEPGFTYRLTGWLKTLSLTGNEGVRLQVLARTPTQDQALLTEDVRGTQDWKQVQLRWTAPPATTLATVCVRRKMSDATGANIQGAAWADDISLVPLAGASSQR